MKLRHGVKQRAIIASFEHFRAYSEAIANESVAQYAQEPTLERSVWAARWPEAKRRAFIASETADPIMLGYVKTMVKREVYSTDISRARLIQANRNLATQSLTAPQIAALQKAVFHALRDMELSPGIFVTVACGLNASDIAKWLEESIAWGSTTYYESDGKNWDGCMQAQHFEARFELIDRFDPALTRLLRQAFSVKGFGRFKEGIFAYKIVGTVKSGHNDTTFGNTIIRLYIAVDVFRRLGVEARIIVAGDDMFVCVRGDFDYSAAVRLEGEYGIVPEARKLYNPYSGSFISGYWVTDGVTVGFLPKLGRLLARLWWTVNPPSRKQLAAYQRGVARGLAGVLKDVPVAREFVLKFDTAGSAVFGKNHREYRGVSFTFGEGIIEHVARRYDASIADVVSCAGWLARVPPKTGFLFHPLLQRMVEYDLAGLPERVLPFE